LRAILDTNVLIRGVLNPSGTPAAAIDAWRDGYFELVTSPELLAELRRVLAERRIARRLSKAAESGRGLVAEMERAGIVVTPLQRVDAVPRDPADNRVLEAAVAGGADYIVSGDQDLTDLVEFEGIPILKPAAFVAVLHAAGILDPDS
jgi:putative PIN family toxin of toxin-antitoxin system